MGNGHGEDQLTGQACQLVAKCYAGSITYSGDRGGVGQNARWSLAEIDWLEELHRVQED